MRISDWSSDVCSSDLEEPEADDQQHRQEVDQQPPEGDARLRRRLVDGDVVVEQIVHHALVAARRGGDAGAAVGTGELDRALVAGDVHFQIGTAACGESVGQYV